MQLMHCEEPALTFFAVCGKAVCLLDQTTQGSLHFPHASVHLGQFTSIPSFDLF